MGWDEMVKAGGPQVAQVPFVQVLPTRPAPGQVLGTLAEPAQGSTAERC